jgi:hypothetical protein
MGSVYLIEMDHLDGRPSYLSEVNSEDASYAQVLNSGSPI